MSIFSVTGGKSARDLQAGSPRDTVTQLIIATVFGLSAFITFCILRPRWKSLYSARKRQSTAAAKLPELPNSFFGWMPVLYRITEDEVLASAGLDAYVFLRFFKMAIKYLLFVLFFSLTVIYPVNMKLRPPQHGAPGNGTSNDTANYYWRSDHIVTLDWGYVPPEEKEESDSYLWLYLIFPYLFSAALIYMLIKETTQIIRVRQRWLKDQSSLTDRTIKLSGIPRHLRSEEKIRETIENLEIGKVESVILCRNWKELDDLVDERTATLRRLETALVAHQGAQTQKKPRWWLSRQSNKRRANTGTEDEQDGLLDEDGYQAHLSSVDSARPTTRIRYGFLNLKYRTIDAIDYYEEKLRRLDEKIVQAREKNYAPTPVAFVTLDSAAACQMAVQAVVDPAPMVLVANLACAPADVVWRNTYMSRRSRMTRAWSITLAIVVLTVIFSIVLVPFAGLLNLKTIRDVSPRLADLLERHDLVKSLVSTGLPTLAVSLATIVVPYLYDWLSNRQGMISQGDVEMSLISKNFFFTFFNLFIVFTVLGTVSSLNGASERLGDQIRDLQGFAQNIGEQLKTLSAFYTNLIVLQAFGLFPFRLLEFGAVVLYPVWRLMAKTPRDYAELSRPPVFSYGFYLPQTLLIFIINIVYSVMQNSALVTVFGLIYFVVGHTIYKYQLLYAMEHRRNSTGRAWYLICVRILVGLIVFQVAMIGELAFYLAFKRATACVPLLLFTIWFVYFYQKTYEPLMKYRALRSLQGDPDESLGLVSESRYDAETLNGRTVDESEETGLRFINPNLIAPLEQPWISGKRPSGTSANANGGSEGSV